MSRKPAEKQKETRRRCDRPNMTVSTQSLRFVSAAEMCAVSMRVEHGNALVSSAIC